MTAIIGNYRSASKNLWPICQDHPVSFSKSPPVASVVCAFRSPSPLHLQGTYFWLQPKASYSWLANPVNKAALLL